MRSGPDYIQFYPTLRCNRSCGFCFNRAMPDVPDMSFGAFRDMLAVLKPLSVQTLDIMGGEPTLHPDIFLFVREAVNNRLSLNLSSNGTNLPLLAEIMQGGGNVTVGLSVNDRETLGQVSGFISAHKPVVKSVFSPDMDFTLIRGILSLGPKRFYLLYRDALSKQDLHETMPFSIFLSEVKQRFAPGQVGTIFCSGFLPHAEAGSELKEVRCPAGTTKLGIMPDGSVYPCNLFFGKREFLLGNVLADPFESIWSHEVLSFFRTFQRNNCPDQSCSLHAKCHGGCPAHGFMHSGSVHATDPRCFHG